MKAEGRDRRGGELLRAGTERGMGCLEAPKDTTSGEGANFMGDRTGSHCRGRNSRIKT